MSNFFMVALFVIFIQIFTVLAERKLVFSNVLFRHGARAPSAEFTNQSYSKLFPRGLGELSDRGINNSYSLGKYLGKRYVETGFLDKTLLNKELYFRSVALPRCLMTAAIVGNAMFEDYGSHLHVPVFTEESGETLLNYDYKTCLREVELVRETCPQLKSIEEFKSWPAYEDFIYQCLNFSNPVFDKYPFQTLEAYYNQHKHGLPLPKIMEKNWEEVCSIYTEVLQFITGLGKHHNQQLMRLKFGNLMSAIMNNITNRWTCYKNKNDKACNNKKNKNKKFIVYSTQDWMLAGVLESFGVLNTTCGMETWPEYNSMIIIELFDNDGKGELKFYYKKNELIDDDSQLIDVTKKIRNCPDNLDYCPLTSFIRCCDDYIELVPGHSCQPHSPETVLEHEQFKKAKKNRNKRSASFFGPE